MPKDLNFIQKKGNIEILLFLLEYGRTQSSDLFKVGNNFTINQRIKELSTNKVINRIIDEESINRYYELTSKGLLIAEGIKDLMQVIAENL